MAFHRFQLAGATFILVCLALTAGCADKTRRDTTTPMAPGAEQGGAGSDGTNAVTNSAAQPGTGPEADAGEPDTSGATGPGGGVAGPPN